MLNLSLQVNPIQLYVKKDEIKKINSNIFYEMEFVLPVFNLPLCFGSKKVMFLCVTFYHGILTCKLTIFMTENKRFSENFLRSPFMFYILFTLSKVTLCY